MAGRGTSSTRSTLRRLLTVAVAALLGLAVVPLAAAPAGAATSDVVLDGGGWGHGRGMSQWGAQGRALAGQSAAQVLGFYYPGASLATRTRGDIRVLVRPARTTLELTVDSSTRLRHVASGATVTPPGDRLRLQRSGSGAVVVSVRTGSTWRVLDVPGFPAAGVPGPVVVTGSVPLGVLTSGGAVQRYRGTMTAVPVSGNRLDLVNALPVEQYLHSVVAAEMPAYFEATALQAQAVAARSYAWSNCSGGAAHFDVRDTTACQVYRGVSLSSGGSTTAYEHPRVTSAVDATKNRVLQTGSSVLRTEFSSSNGGWTVATASTPSRADAYDGRDSRNANHRWTQTLAPAAFERAWPQIGTFRSARVVADEGAGPFGGRVQQLEVVGSTGSVVVPGGTARTALGLKSTLFDIRSLGLSDVLTYDEDSGRQVVSRIHTGGKPSGLASGLWQKGRDEVVALDLPSGQDGVLTYERSSGAATMYRTEQDGSFTELWRKAWSPGWDSVVAVEGDGGAGSEILTYRRDTGRAVLSDVPASGSSTTLWMAAWSPGWDTVMAAEGDGSAGSEVLTYRSDMGRVVMSDMPRGAKSPATLWMAWWSPGWDHLVALETDGSAGTELLTYSSGNGRAVLTDMLVGGSARTIWLTVWSRGWDEVVGLEADGTAGAEVLTYDVSSGRTVISDLRSSSPSTLWMGSWTPGWDAVVDLRSARP